MNDPEAGENSWPGITAVIPTHGRPKELQAAVASVLQQEYPGELEIIVVFDGEPARPLPRSERPRISIRSIENTERSRGLAGARNAGILAASHELVGFLDDDDEWLPDRLPAQVSLLRRHPEAVLIGGSIRATNERGTFIRRCPDTITHADLLRERVTELHPCTYLIRRQALLGELGLVDEDLPGSFAEDYDLALRAAAIAPIRAVTQPVAAINWVGGSFFIDTWERNAEGIRYLLRKHDFTESPKGQARLEGYVAYCLAAAGHGREARAWARQALRRDRTEKRAWLSFAISHAGVTPERLASAAARLGKRW